MRKLVLSSLTCVCLTFAAAAPAFATQQCTSHEKMIELLAKRFSEVPKAIGLVGKKRVMEVYVSKTGTWTILVTNSEGQTCILAAGQNWEDVPDKFANLDPAA